MILLIDNYDSFTFNLVHFFGDLGANCVVRRNDALTPNEALAMQPEAIVLSPGPCTPNEAGICLDLVKAAAGKIPLFGVCLGHQAIGQAFGGNVIRAPSPVHGKTSPAIRKSSPPKPCPTRWKRRPGRRKKLSWGCGIRRCLFSEYNFIRKASPPRMVMRFWRTS